jgi:protein involved in polysaccharide export with SLBB domain
MLCAMKKRLFHSRAIALVAVALACGLLSSGCRSVGIDLEENEKDVVEFAPRAKPGLVLHVAVLVSGKKEIDEPSKRVSDDGVVALPLIGNVDVQDMSLTALSEDLTRRYREYYVDPQVVVDFVMDPDSDAVSPWGSVTVLGRVKKPGRVNIPPTQDLTVSRAIQRAGGLDTSARDSAIRVTRRKNGDKTEVFEIDLRAVGSRGQAKDDLGLKPGDIVFVPEMIF